jgi:glycine oxidase
MTIPDFAVLGAGLSGRLIAWMLAGRGHQVALYEKGDASGTGTAAWTAAAMLAPLVEATLAHTLIAELGSASLTRWPALLAQLPEPVFFQRAGTLVVWHPADRVEADLFSRQLHANAPAELLATGMELLHGTRLNDLEPALAGRFKQGWWLPNEGQLDNRQLLNALLAGLNERHVRQHWHTAIEASNLPRAGVLIDCRGLGSKPDWPALRGVRGEVVRLHAPGIHLHRPIRFLHPRYPLYIAPKQDDRYVIGATTIEGEDDSPVSVRSALELLSAAFSVHPEFGEARILELSAQNRPTLPDHQPAIVWERIAGQPSVGQSIVRINGLYRHGYLIAPEVVQQAAHFCEDLLLGKLQDTAAFENWRAAARWPALMQFSLFSA